MSGQSTSKNSSAGRTQRIRRVLIVAPGPGSVLRPELIASGYETAAAGPESALTLVADYAPDIVIFELAWPEPDAIQHFLALARRLRSDASTYALPLVFCCDADDRSLRASLIGLGADDFFPASTPIKETLARLDALFWRIEAGRRAASTTGDQRLDIDNFMLLLDNVRDDIRSGLKGTVALIYAVPPSGVAGMDRAARDKSLSETNGYLRLNLRRADSATFYGPTTILVYMPGFELDSAVERLRSIRNFYVRERSDRDFAAGLASFTSKDDSLELIMEKAETASGLARESASVERIVALALSEPQARVAEVATNAVPAHSTDVRLNVAAVAEPASVKPTESASLETETIESQTVEPKPAPAARIEQPLVESQNQVSPEEVEISLDFEDETSYPELTVDESKVGAVNSPKLTFIPPEIRDAGTVENESNPAIEVKDDVEVDEAPQELPPYYEAPPQNIRSSPAPEPQTPPDDSVSKTERKTFFSRGFDSTDVSELTMADIMEKVAATRVRSTGDSEHSTEAIRQVSQAERRLREGGTRMFSNLLLVVSDTRRMATLNSLVRGAGYEVRAAFSGRQALDLLRLERPDLIIIDHRLSGMDGLETIRRLRRQSGDRLPGRVVALVAEDENDIRNEALNLGVDMIIAANYDPAELLGQIRALAENR